MIKIILLLTPLLTHANTLNQELWDSYKCGKDGLHQFIKDAKYYSPPEIWINLPPKQIYEINFNHKLAETAIIAASDLSYTLGIMLNEVTNDPFWINQHPLQIKLTHYPNNDFQCDNQEQYPQTHICFVDDLWNYYPIGVARASSPAGFAYIDKLHPGFGLWYSFLYWKNYFKLNTPITNNTAVYINKTLFTINYEQTNSTLWAEILKKVIKHEILHTMGFCHYEKSPNIMNTIIENLYLPEEIHYILNLPEPITVKEGHFYMDKLQHETNTYSPVYNYENSGRIWAELNSKLRKALLESNERLTVIDKTQFENWFNTVKTKKLVL